MILKTNSNSGAKSWSRFWQRSYHNGPIIKSMSQTWGHNWSRLNGNCCWSRIANHTWSQHWSTGI